MTDSLPLRLVFATTIRYHVNCDNSVFPMALRLYHFTSELYLPAIIADGLRWGDVPTGAKTGFNAVWLTAVGESTVQQWVARTDKNRIRLTLEFPDPDPLLIKWSDFKNSVETATYEVLHRTGAGLSDAWYIYRGTLPWSRVVEAMDTGDNQELSRTIIPSHAAVEVSRKFSNQARKNMEKKFKDRGITYERNP
jgi:hypothetical protein